MYNRRIISYLAIFSAFCMLLTFHQKGAFAAEGDTQYVLRNVTADISADSMTVTLLGSMAPAYTSRELYDPYRLIVDIAEASFAENLETENLIPQNKFASLQTTVVRGLEPEITRFIFTISEGYRQNVERRQNDIVISILPVAGPENQSDIAQEGSGMTGDEVGVPVTDPEEEANAKIRELIESTAQSVTTDGSALTSEEEMEKSFDFSGYKRERVSIDFYKIDLHNVFRLFRQVSGLNLIVDEAVSGSLTLALNDVPWDFALDIILNLADLEKEERFNTIIIYPKSKEFDWPERAANNLSFEANLDVVQQEALIIEQSAKQPKEIMQAKELMRKALLEEKNNNYENAVELYEEAAELWPSNSKLTNKLAALYLVRMGMNAKGVFYAKKSLEAQPDNANAALYAAIGMANMNKNQEAVEYFSRSISGNPPMKEALASFAAFSENSGRLEAALKLYDKYHEVYGQTVDTMVAKARIFDNMGMTKKATEQYRSVMNSGFPLNLGLKRYIQSRLAEASQ